jgi:ubiquinone/menaquinone biosynthesis C-methylase UbiE
MKKNLNEILAYKKLNLKSRANKRVTFDDLISLSKKCRSPIFEDLKIYMILTIKWHFDFLAKTRKNPSDLDLSLNFWFNTFNIFYEFEKLGWITKKNKNNLKLNVWQNTRKAFNFMWPKNTSKKKYDASRVMVDLRINQIVKQISNNKNFLNGKTILDSGCGPGRYMESLSRFKPKELIGIDSGKDIIDSNKKRFKRFKNMKFIKSKFDKLYFKDESIDLIVSAGVLHHTNTSIASMIRDHSRVIKKGGHFFVFIAGSGGQELDLWRFCRRVMIDVNMEYAFKRLSNLISPLRMQGILDHSYGEYKSTSRKSFEKMLKKSFSKVSKVDGVEGADVTPKTFKGDKYFNLRFGSGNLRYLCQK